MDLQCILMGITVGCIAISDRKKGTVGFLETMKITLN